MEDLGHYVDFPTPPNSMYYVYGDGEQYLSESQSPNNLSVGLPTPLSGYPSPGHEDGESAEASEPQKPAAKRKRENRYKNAPPAVLSRRRAQNRASQRAYRERKDQRIKDLERMLNEAKQRNDVLSQAYATLHAEYIALKSSQMGDTSYTQQFDGSVLYGSGDSVSMGLNAGSGGDGFEAISMYGYGDMNTSTGYTL
ncbi:hypothetical protein C7999DRAFT_16847 [Corynascus novoguineensis]|uniref:Putative transcription factor kapC n=1 Tax=Corynascus novoguineensis TaxID=1126955 RepID=A0AAN7HCP5_9PEZI|nr:hypothetical protein C7999DRAFT_16847 [Corynascus novoguineensis]